MSELQPTFVPDYAHDPDELLPIIATSADIATDIADGGQRSAQRIGAFRRELAQTQGELARTKLMLASEDEDCAALHQDLIAEREARTNEQNRADAIAANLSAVHLKLLVWRRLCERVLAAHDEDNRSEYLSAIRDIRAALGVVGGATL